MQTVSVGKSRKELDQAGNRHDQRPDTGEGSAYGGKDPYSPKDLNLLGEAQAIESAAEPRSHGAEFINEGHLALACR